MGVAPEEGIPFEMFRARLAALKVMGSSAKKDSDPKPTVPTYASSEIRLFRQRY